LTLLCLITTRTKRISKAWIVGAGALSLAYLTGFIALS
jgi:hypothetical protein